MDGGDHFTQPWGLVGDFRYFGRALSVEEIRVIRDTGGRII